MNNKYKSYYKSGNYSSIYYFYVFENSDKYSLIGYYFYYQPNIQYNNMCFQKVIPLLCYLYYPNYLSDPILKGVTTL